MGDAFKDGKLTQEQIIRYKIMLQDTVKRAADNKDTQQRMMLDLSDLK